MDGCTYKMIEQINEIKKHAGDITVLYVEDNEGLRNNMTSLFSRMFDNILVAKDGEEGYETFLKSKPKIIITDLNMPKLNGFKMIKKIKAVEPETKIIILSAFDEKKHLHAAIDLGVFHYAHKPAKMPELVQAIYNALLAIQEEENRRLFLSQIQTIFNYQNNMVVMMHKEKFILSNQRFLEFFEVDDLKNFAKKYNDFDTNLDGLLLEHKDFLYTTPLSNWQDVVVANPGKLFHTKIKNPEGEMRHLILKSREVPEKEGRCVLSFDDVTELNLMAIFDTETTNNDLIVQDKKAILSFMKIIQDNSAEVKIHNFYKGLTIVNPAVISNITENEVTFKTAYQQLKIASLTRYMTISSEIFPKRVVSTSVKSIDLDNQSIVISEMKFTTRSSVNREFIRLEPEKEHRCTLFYKDIKFSGTVKIVDLSEVSVKLEINALPPGMQVGETVKVSMNLTRLSKVISIITDATIFRIDEHSRNFDIVTLFELDIKNKHAIKEYLASRQMELIREFKKMDIV